MTKLYVGSLPYSITNESLLQLFFEKGYKPASARVITDRDSGRSKGFGFVELGPEDDAAKAIGEFNGMNVEGRALQVNGARPKNPVLAGIVPVAGAGFPAGGLAAVDVETTS